MIDHRSPGIGAGGKIRAVASAAQTAARASIVQSSSRRSVQITSKCAVIDDAQRVARVIFWIGRRRAVELQVRALPFLPLGLAVALIDTIDAVEDLAVHCRAQKLQIFGVSPNQRNRRSSRLPLQSRSGRSALVPHLLRHHLAQGCETLVSLNQRLQDPCPAASS